MVIHAFSQSSRSSLLCAAGIGRTAQAAPETGVPAQTACRETYGLLLYAGVAQSDRAEQGKCRVSVAGSSPAVCTRGRVAPGHCETVRRGSHGNDNAR